MSNELELEAIIEDYLKGNLSAEEMVAFEELRKNNPAIDHKVIGHKVFLETLTSYGEAAVLQEKLDTAHDALDMNALVKQYQPKPSLVVRLYRYKAAFAVAASFVVALILSAYVFTTQQSSSYMEMRNELTDIKKSQDGLIRKIDRMPGKVNPGKANLGKFVGTGFALSSNGYICTNYHVVKDADSVYVQNNKGDSYKVQVIFTDPQYDLAILKVTDPSFSNLPHLPYGLKIGTVGLGETVYTLGFPKDEAVLGEGYVSSKSGFNGDTTKAYQVALPVNPGNSGGPLLDNNGNIVGVISGREDQSYDAAFAIKSKYVSDALKAIPQDSLNNKISSKKTTLQGLKRPKQIEKIQDYVFMVRVYN